MAYNGSGTYIRVTSWQADATAKIKILSNKHDTQDDDFANALSNVICKDGQSQPVADLPMNGHKFTNLGPPVVGTDSATKAYVDGVKAFSTGLAISGADANGQLSFSSATGANGLSFTGADLSWLARLATAAGPGTPPVPPATLNRLVLNTKPDGSGTDVITVNDDGTLVANGAITAGAILYAKAASGNVHLWLQGPAGEDRMVLYTDSASMAATTLRVNGTQSFVFNTDGEFTAPNQIHSGGAVFASGAYLNTDGNINGSAWGGWISNWVSSQVSNAINGGNFQSTSGSAILASAGGNAVYLRPNGPGSGAGQMFVEGNGVVDAIGIKTRTGLSGAFGANSYTIYHTGTTQQLRIDDTYMGNFAYQCDYRIKKDIKPLPSVWEGIKKLRPVSYTPKAHGVFTDSDEMRWGLIAHEAQEALAPAVASGVKDGEDIQSPDLMALITALAKGLQEAMLRIEALEANLQ